MLGDDIDSWPGDWKDGAYTWPRDSFIISGPLEYYYSPIILDNQIVEPKGEMFESWRKAYEWVAAKHIILEVLPNAEAYGRWCFRVQRRAI